MNRAPVPGDQLPPLVTVINPDTAGIVTWPLHRDAGGHITIGPDEAALDRRPTTYLSPGWVDIHTHVFHGFTQIGIRPDRAGLDTGVHLIADAGSAGQMTVRGLLDYVMPTAQTAVRSWLNIGSHGLVHLRETAHPSFIDVDATIAAIEASRGIICGVKVRSSGAIVGAMGLQPLQLARLVAREVKLPLMVHIGEAPPPIADVLALLNEGDVITHCYHGKTGRPWLSDGTPTAELQGALDRGVQLDVGHGAASFDVRVARAALEAGFAPTTISTDIHVRNVNGPVHDLATVMTKMLDCGMNLTDVVTAVTASARRVIGEAASQWITTEGRVREATLFTLTDQPPPGRRYIDSAGQVITPMRHIVPVAVIVNGVYRTLAATG